MTYWLLPWDKTVFNLSQCIHDLGFVEWRQKNRLAVGDIVFLYGKTPIRQIVYMMEVSKINIPYAETINDDYLFNNKEKFKESNFYARFEPIAKASENNVELSYAKLKELGVKSTLQRGIRVPDVVLSHILSHFDVEYDEVSQTYTEGEAHRVSVTKYERNPQARVACLSKYGYSCQICGLSFEEKYGPIGKDFIHVHHIHFISSEGGMSHGTDPLKDLISVCPNCHAMLHRKLDGKYLSPLQLKKLLEKHASMGKAENQ